MSLEENIIKSDLSVIFCPPLSLYLIKPYDISAATIEPCPTCKQDMWYSEVKKEIMRLSIKHKKQIIFECYTCFLDRIKQNPDEWRNHEIIVAFK